jgi:predicted ATPase
VSALTGSASGTAPTIRTPDQRLRVFISSTLGELADERAAIRHAVESLRLTPVMFELGARPHPPRALYRAYLAQSDIFIGVYWERYGWVAPDMDISGLEDEYLLSDGMPRLIYIKRPAGRREDRLTELLARIQADDAVSYRPFDDAGELVQLLGDDLAIMLSERFVSTAPPESPAPSFLVAPPAPRTPLVGRDAEVQQLVEVLTRDDTRLVTLTGTGGVGKTRMAIAALAAAAARWPEHRAFIDLSAVTDPGQVGMAITSALGIVPEGRQSPLDALRTRLGESDALLVLDNFEQVSAAADVLAELLGACPGLTLLVTSRTVLHLLGEVEWPVQPLATAGTGDVDTIMAAPAVRLLVARAQAVRPGFAVTPSNAGDIDRLVRRLDGLPLALELAAAQLRLLPPAALLRRLDEQLDLAGVYTDLPPRQRSLHATLDWSHQLLTPRQRTIFARLSVFAGGCDLDSAGAVCDLEDARDIVEVVSALVECSLVTVQDGGHDQPRLRMLETVRDYARRELEQLGETDAVLRRLVEHLTDFVARADAGMLQRGHARSWMNRLDAEVDNIKTAIEWALRNVDIAATARLTAPVWLYWWIRGQGHWLDQLADRVREAASEHPSTQVRLELSWLQGGVHFMRGRFTEAIPWIREAVTLARAEGLWDTVAWCLSGLGTCLTREEDYTEARAALEESVAIFRRLGTPLGVGYAATHLGDIMLVDGDLKGAIATHTECLDIARSYANDHLTAQAACHLGFDHLITGDLDQARSRFAEAGRLFSQLHHVEGTMYCLAGLAGVAHQQEQLKPAACLLGSVTTIRQDMGFAPWPLLGHLESMIAAGVRDAIGAAAFDEAAGEGGGLTAAAALEYGLAVTAAAGARQPASASG